MNENSPHSHLEPHIVVNPVGSHGQVVPRLVILTLGTEAEEVSPGSRRGSGDLELHVGLPWGYKAGMGVAHRG